MEDNIFTDELGVTYSNITDTHLFAIMTRKISHILSFHNSTGVIISAHRGDGIYKHCGIQQQVLLVM